MTLEELKEEVDLLLLEWEVHSHTDSRYAAMLHLLKVWLFDPNNGTDEFPEQYVLRLITISRSKDRSTRAMAFSAVVLIVMRFDAILPQSVIIALEKLYSDETLRKDMVEVQQYFFTSVISLKVKKELGDKLPGIMGSEHIRGKLGMDEVRKQLGEMVDDGIDMNQGTFIAMSQHEFFKNLRNWLIDFDINNPALNASKNQGALAIFSSMTNLCDLDKYAMALTMSRLNGINIMIEQLPEGIMDSVNTEEMKKEMKKVTDKFAYMYTFQTLYRLFRLSPWRKLLYDPFQMGPFMTDFSKLVTLCSTKAFLEKMSHLFMRHEFYAHAAAYARSLLNHDDSAEDMLQVLANCDKHLEEYKEHIECLLRLEKMKPDDLDIAAEAGLALLEAKRYEEALQRFFHMEVMDKGTRRSTRAIAWCSLMTRNTKRSERYYKKLLAWRGGPSWMDVLNAGHSAWLSGDPVRASQLYSRYLQMHSDQMQAFINDKPQLQELGFTEDDIEIMKSTVLD